MLTCRSIPPKTWEYARQALVFYFSRRHGSSVAEDLAHETLAAVWARDDYEFEKEEDFLRVCYGFATHVLQRARRDASKSAAPGIESDSVGVRIDGKHRLGGLELHVYLKELLKLGRQELRREEWSLIEEAGLAQGGVEDRSDAAAANRKRVRLHRARRKLADLVGWGKRRV